MTKFGHLWVSVGVGGDAGNSSLELDNELNLVKMIIFPIPICCKRPVILIFPPGMLAMLIDVAAGSNDYGDHQQRHNCVEHLIMIIMTMTIMTMRMMMMMYQQSWRELRCNFRDGWQGFRIGNSWLPGENAVAACS